MPKALALLTGQALASIEDPVVIGKVLAHVGETASVRKVVRLPGSRAPPDGWV